MYQYVVPFSCLISLLFCITPNVQAQEDEVTLPEVVVEPITPTPTSPETVTDVAPPVSSEFETASPVTAAPAIEVAPSQATNLFESLPSYPSLSSLEFGSSDGFGSSTGILRSPTSLFDSAAAGSITTRDRLNEKQSADMFSALQQEVGVLMQSTAAGQASPFVRGVTGQQVLILMDGIRLNNSIFRFGPNQYFNTIDSGMVDHIEVVRGQGSVLWGSDAIGGAINVVTRGADVHQGRFRGDYVTREFHQTYNTANDTSYSRANIEGWVGSSGLFAGGSFLNVRDLETGWDFGTQPGTNYQQYSGDIKFNYLLDANSLLTFSFQHVEQDELPRSDRFPGYPGDRNNSNNPGNARFFDPQQRDLAYIRYQAIDPLPLVDALTVTGSYHRQRDVQTRGIPIVRSQETDVESVGMNVVGVKDFDTYGKITTGVDWYHDDVDSAFGGTAGGPIIPDDAFYERIGTFVNWEVPLTSRLHGSAGVRYEHLDLAATPSVGGANVFISPNYDDLIAQAGLVYEINPCVHLVGSISEGFRAPNLDELTANNPNVLQQGMDLPSLGLTPEQSTSYEVGLKTDFDRLRTQTFVYWMQLDDNIVPVVAGANQFTRANQDSFIQGAEFDGELLIDRQWSVFGNLTYTYGTNLVTDSPLSRIPPTQGITGLRWRQKCRLSYFEIYTWMVRRQDRLDPVRDFRDERIPIGGTPGFATLNMRAGRTFGSDRQHRLSLGLENMTDKNYLVHGSGVFGTGFTARFGYSWVY